MNPKEQARAFYKAMSSYDEEQIRALAREDYIQHNLLVPTGRKALLDLMTLLRSEKSQIQNHLILSQGSFVVMLHRWSNSSSFAPEGASTTWGCHIIRLDSEQRVAEHWCAMNANLSSELPLDTVGNELKTHFLLQDGTQTFTVHEHRNGNDLQSIYEFQGIRQIGLPKHFYLIQEIPQIAPKNDNGVFNFPTRL